MTKQPHKSLTLWVNFVILLLSLFDHDFFKLMGLSEHSSLVLMGVIVKLTAALNLVLRVFFTNGSITFKKEE